MEKIGKRFQGKVAIVTASTQGIGFGIAERLGLEGASVVLSSRKQVPSCPCDSSGFVEFYELWDCFCVYQCAYLIGEKLPGKEMKIIKL